MFRRIVVPLDGSPLPEAVLPDVFTLAAGADAELLLLSVVPPPRVFAVAEELQEESFRGDFAGDADQAVAAIEHGLTAPEEARRQRYLDEWAEHLAVADFAVRTLVRVGDAATEIVRCAREEQADAIAMSTHGRGGLDRVLHGSVAETVLRTAGLPVLLVRPTPEDLALHHLACEAAALRAPRDRVEPAGDCRPCPPLDLYFAWLRAAQPGV
jgi:nucleotide-binding universal stress UspA family protein